MYSARGGTCHVHELLERQDRGPLLEERAEVLERVDLVDDVVVVRVFADLLDAAVEVAEDRIHVHDLLARELEDEAKDAVGGRVVRAEVEEHLAVAQGVELALALGLGRVRRDRLEQPANLAVEHDARVIGGAMLLGRARLLGPRLRSDGTGRHLCPQLSGARRMAAAGSSARSAGR